MRQRWQDDLKKLMTDIKQWASSAGWKVDSIQREIEEVSIGLYSAEELIINISANKRIHIEVMGRGDEYSPGKVEMFAWPTLIRVLFFKKDEWSIRTDATMLLDNLNEESFIKYAGLITGDD